MAVISTVSELAALPVQDPEEPVQLPVTLPVTLLAHKTLIHVLCCLPPSTFIVSPAVVDEVSANTT